MFPRSSNFIYKPYCTFLTSKIHVTTSGSRGLDNKNNGQNSPNSTCYNLPNPFLWSSQPPVINAFFVPDVLKKEALKNHCNQNTDRHVVSKRYRTMRDDKNYIMQSQNGCLLRKANLVSSMIPPWESSFSLEDSKPTYIDTIKFYTNKVEKQLDRNYLSLLSKVSNIKHPSNTPQNRSTKNGESKKESEWNDLPTDDQMDEMITYFHNEAPKTFTQTGWSYLKCSYKVIFENRIAGTKTETLNSYIMQINLMRNLTKMILYSPELHILRMTKDVSDGSIHVRWQVVGAPRYILPLSYLGLIDENNSMRYIDGFSIFYMKKDGLYHRHVLMNMTPRRIPGFKNALSQIFTNLMYRPALKPNLGGANVSNDNT